MKLLKSILVVFLLTYCTHSFAKSNEYYQATIIHLLTECNSKCKDEVFKREVDKSFISLMNAILNQVRWELTMKEKELYD